MLEFLTHNQIVVYGYDRRPVSMSIFIPHDYTVGMPVGIGFSR